jgi:hypothetical protein
MSRCPTCQGTGKVNYPELADIGLSSVFTGHKQVWRWMKETACPDCQGSGSEPESKTEIKYSLRDLFAIAALSNYRVISINDATSAADWAYTYADAMMERRKR